MINHQYRRGFFLMFQVILLSLCVSLVWCKGSGGGTGGGSHNCHSKDAPGEWGNGDGHCPSNIPIDGRTRGTYNTEDEKKKRRDTKNQHTCYKQGHKIRQYNHKGTQYYYYSSNTITCRLEDDRQVLHVIGQILCDNEPASGTMVDLRLEFGGGKKDWTADQEITSPTGTFSLQWKVPMDHQPQLRVLGHGCGTKNNEVRTDLKWISSMKDKGIPQGFNANNQDLVIVLDPIELNVNTGKHDHISNVGGAMEVKALDKSKFPEIEAKNY